jgi:hypothetical protein
MGGRQPKTKQQSKKQHEVLIFNLKSNLSVKVLKTNISRVYIQKVTLSL